MMTKSEIIERLDGYALAPDSSEYCDALCDAAEYLGLPDGEYQYDDLRERVESVDE